MLHALVLADLESEGEITGKEAAFKYELIDVAGIDHASMMKLRHAGRRQLDLVLQWLQTVIIEAQQSGVLVAPPPILSRVFQELSGGVKEYHKTLSLAEVAFPLPYTAATHVVLVMHWLLTPIMACTWSTNIGSAAGIAFIQVFMLWSLNAIATELENPFGSDINDLDTLGRHCELNERLMFLLGTAGQQAPTLSHEAVLDPGTVKADISNSSLSVVLSKGLSSKIDALTKDEDCESQSYHMDEEDRVLQAGTPVVPVPSLSDDPESQFGLSAKSQTEPVTLGGSVKSNCTVDIPEQSMVDRQPERDQPQGQSRLEQAGLKAHQSGNQHHDSSVRAGSVTSGAVAPSDLPASALLAEPRKPALATNIDNSDGYIAVL